MASAIGRGATASFLCVASALLLAGCGATNGGDVVGNLLAFNSLKAPPPIDAQKPIVDVDCPEVTVDNGGGTVRIYAGADQSNDDVKYQYDIGQYARQCDVENGQLAIKVGVEGRVLLGPAGSAGTFVAPVRIAIERQSDDSIVTQQVYQTPVTVAPGVGEAVFDTVSQPFLVPFTRQQADQDYSIVVGFDQPGAASKPAKAKPRRRRHV
jgi:hypothetical protein